MQSLLWETTTLVWSGFGVFCGWQLYKGDPRFYSRVVMPHIHYFCNPERAHNLAIKLLSWRFVPKASEPDDPILETNVFSKEFKSPIGLAAGFDKHAEAMAGLERIGFGFVEVGSITPLPQEGNKKPRVFRLTEDNAVINRYGFNSCGHKQASERLAAYTSSRTNDVVLGVNLGKNKTSTNAIDDYVKGVESLGKYADYIVVNVSSPNTPGLRKLQEGEHLEKICTSVLKARNKLPNKPAVLVKIAPDLNEYEKEEVAKTTVKTRVDGLIVSNTTVQRPESLRSNHKNEAGGLSGEPLREKSTRLISDMYTLTAGKVPIIGVGGVENGLDAYEKIRAGASLVQLYTALTYHGPPLVSVVKKQLTYLLKRDQFSSVSEAVGADHR